LLLNFLFQYFRKSAENIQGLFKSKKTNGALHECLIIFMIIFPSDILKMRNVSEKIVEKTKKHFIFKDSF